MATYSGVSSGGTYAISGTTSGSDAIAVLAESTGTNQALYAYSTGGNTISAYWAGSTNSTRCLEAINQSTGTGCYGVLGSAQGGSGYGVYATVSGSGGTGLYATASASGSYGVYSYVTAAASFAGYFWQTDSTADNTPAVYISGASDDANCVHITTSGSTAVGVHADASSGYAGVYANGGSFGVYANALAGGSTDCWGVYGVAVSSSHGIAILAYGAQYGGYFTGNVHVTADFSCAGTKAFKIDHPLDPENKHLLHAAVESPEVKNVYDGVVVADAKGEATVQLPSYFEALNKDFRYQLTAIGAAAPGLHVKQEVNQGGFTLAGAAAGQKVCWQVTGIRNDPTMRHRRFVAEVEKDARDKGFYEDPLAYGQPREKGIDWKYHKVTAEKPKAPPRRPPAPPPTP